MSTYVFAIGGSGARVLRSLTMLLAAGCKNTAVDKKIVPIIIDYDVSNGDTLRTQELMGWYHDLHEKAYLSGDKVLVNEQGQQQKKAVAEQFFCNPLRMLREECDDPSETFHETSRYNIYLEDEDTNSTFAKHINYASLKRENGTAETRQLLESLYDLSPETIEKDGKKVDNPRAEIYMNLHKGFRGCPNLGCIVTGQLEKSKELEFALNSIKTGDRVVIIGSVFGGTGASGIPTLLDMLENKSKNAQNGIEKAVIAIMPYFDLLRDENSSIDHRNFVAKSKAAINAYEIGGENSVNNKAGRFYYVGDKSRNAFANNDGDEAQKNDAHYVELFAAMCVMDFITQTQTGGFECALKNWQDNELNCSAFFKDELYLPYIHPLARFKLFTTFYKRTISQGKVSKTDAWFHGMEDDGAVSIGDDECKDYRATIEKFIEAFDTWIKELSNENSHRPLVLFGDTTDYREVFKWEKIEKTIKVPVIGTKISKELLDDKVFFEEMAKSYTKLNPRSTDGIKKRPEYVFWCESKDTMDAIDNNILKKNNLL